LYAIIKCSGKQFKIREGDFIDIDKINLKENEDYNLDHKSIVLISDNDNLFCGENVKSAIINLSVVKNFKGKKVVVYKFKSKKGYHKKSGYRSLLTKIKIKKISLN
jgi:large subunit ribosomal protein L21